LDLNNLEKLEFSGLRGNSLSQKVQRMHEEFEEMYKVFLDCSYDCLDPKGTVGFGGAKSQIWILLQLPLAAALKHLKALLFFLRSPYGSVVLVALLFFIVVRRNCCFCVIRKILIILYTGR
jgi:hypothetical protein